MLKVEKIIAIIKKNKSRFSSIGQYFFASLVPLILNIAINPLVAQNMSTEDYATVGYFKSYNTLVLPIVLFYVLHYYTKRFYEVKEDERLILKAYIFKFLFVASFVLALVSIACLYLYTICFNADSQIPLYPYAWICLMSLPLTGIYSLVRTDYKMSQNSKNFLVISVIYSVLTAALLLFFVVFFKWGALGNLLSVFITNLVLFIYCSFKYRALFYIPTNFQNYKVILKFCTPLTVAATLGFFTNGYDRVYWERLGNVDEFGFYIVAFSICNYLHVFADAVGNTFQPDIFRAIANRNTRSFFKYTMVILVMNALIVAVFVPLAPFVADILTAGKYLYSAGYMKILAVSSFASTVYFVISQFTVAVGLTNVTLYNKILTSLLSVAMFKVLIDNFQFIGAAWGVSLSFVISSIGNLLFVYIYRSKLMCYWNKK